MSQFVQNAIAQLRAIDSVLPAALLTTFVFVTVYLVRRFFPKAWLFVEKTVPFVDSIDPGPGLNALWKSWQAWPAMALGAVTSALLNGISVKHALWGVFCGALSALAHTMMSLYQGKVGGPAKPERMFPSDPPLPPNLSGLGALLLAVCFALHSTGCAWFKGSFWPNVEHCAPSPASLLTDVSQILEAGSDYESALEQLALVKGKDLVLCAVEAFVNSIGNKVGASPQEMSAHARGKAFLADHPVGK